MTIQERVCGSPFDNDIVCQAGLLAEYAVPGNSMASATFPAASTLFVRKDIHLLSDSFISEFTNSHELAPVPEPATLRRSRHGCSPPRRAQGRVSYLG